MLEVGCWGQRVYLRKEGLRLTQLQLREQLQSCLWDLLLVTCPLPQGVGCACRTLLMASRVQKESLAQVSAERVVSFGLSPRDTLTLTAMADQQVLCIQREIVTLSGRRLQPREIPLPPQNREESPEELLARAGLGLLLEL